MLFAEILFGSTKGELRVDILLIRTQAQVPLLFSFWIKDILPNMQSTFLDTKLSVLGRSTDPMLFELHIIMYIVTSKEDTITEYPV